MRIFLSLTILSVSLFAGCQGRAKPPQLIFNKDFNWRIEIPEGFETVPPAQWKKMQARGAEAIEKTYDTEVENNATTIFVFKSDQQNYFESNHQPYDSTAFDSYDEQTRTVNAILYDTFEAQMPGAALDSISSKETIDGKIFHTYKVTITIPDKVTMEFYMFSRLFGNREFSVMIITVDKAKQAALLKAWRQSTFESQ